MLPGPEQGAAVSVQEAADCIRDSHGFTIDPATGCWLWEWCDPSGFGPARSFYIARFGGFPPTLRIAHTCDNGPAGCVNPDHLDLVSGDLAPPVAEATVAEAAWFRERLADELAARGDRARMLAAELAISEALLARWLDGTAEPSVDDVRRCRTNMGWDNEPRRWTITVLAQVVVTGRSAGDAVRKARDLVTPMGQVPKMTVVEARQVGVDDEG